MPLPTGGRGIVFGLSAYLSINKVCVTWYLFSGGISEKFAASIHCVRGKPFLWGENLKRFSNAEVKRSGSLKLVDGNFVDVTITLVTRRILTKLASTIHHASGKNWQGFYGPLLKSRSLGVHLLHLTLKSFSAPVSVSLCTNVWMLMMEAYILTLRRRVSLVYVYKA